MTNHRAERKSPVQNTSFEEEIFSASLFTDAELINILPLKPVDNPLKTLFKTIEN
jgi:hypothetical protein